MNFVAVVQTSDLEAGLKTLGRAAKKNAQGQAVIREEDGHLVIEHDGVAFGLPYEGDWRGHLWLDGTVLVRLAGHLPRQRTIRIGMEDQQLRLGGMRIPCHWDAAEGPKIVLPDNPRLIQLVGLGLRNTRDELRHAGILGVVEKAEARTDDFILRAAKALEKLEIPESEVRRMVEEWARRLPVG